MLQTDLTARARRVLNKAGSSLSSQNQDGASFVDAAYWDTNEYGSRSCDSRDVQEFKKRFGRKSAMRLSELGQEDLLAVNNDPGISPNHVLFLYPDLDEKQSAFELEKHMCYRLLEWARLYKTVRFLHVSSVTEAAAILTKCEDASIDHLVVGGHGARGSIEFNAHVSNGELKVGDRLSTWFWSVARAKLTPTASLFLDSCLNAAEPDQIADRAWKNHLMFVSHLMPGYRVHASSISLRADQTVVTDFLNFHVLIRNVTSGAPGDAKSSKNHVVVGNCENTPRFHWQHFPRAEQHWTDSIGNTCQDYALKGLCLANLDQQKSKGIEYNGSKLSAWKACCACGGGELVTKSKDLSCPPGSFSYAPKNGFWKSVLGNPEEEPSECRCGTGTTCVKGDGSACDQKTIFPMSCVDCVCVVSNAENAECEGGICTCKDTDVCYEGATQGCDGHDGQFKTSCLNCHCKTQASRNFLVTCGESGSTACNCKGAEATCYKGDRYGKCPAEGEWASLTPTLRGNNHGSFDGRCDGCECRKPCRGDGLTEMSRNGVCKCSKNGLVKSGLDKEYDVSCESCSCQLASSVCSLGQKVFYRDFGKEWNHGEITSLKGGVILVSPVGWAKGFAWDEVAISKNESTRPWKDGDRAGIRDREDSDWAYGTVTGLTHVTGQPAEVLRDGWDVAYSWKFYKQLPEGYGCQ